MNIQLSETEKKILGGVFLVLSFLPPLHLVGRGADLVCGYGFVLYPELLNFGGERFNISDCNIDYLKLLLEYCISAVVFLMWKIMKKPPKN